MARSLLLFSPRMSVGMVGFCNALARASDHSRTSIVLVHGPCEVPLDWPGPRVELPMGRSLKEQAFAACNPVNFWRIMHVIRRHNVDRIYMVSSHPIDLLLAAAAPALGVRVCFHLHDPVPHSSQRGAAAVWRFNRLIGRIPLLRVATSSETMRALVVTSGLKSTMRDICVVPLPVSVPRRKPIRPHAGRDIVLMIGRVESYKCPEAFVEIANRCRSSSPDLEFLIAGPDEHGLIPPLASECRRVGVQLDVRRLPEATFADYVGRAMAVCMPYRDASDSGVAPIAFEFGTPVIGSAVGGLVASIQHDVNGVLCCPGEINQFVDAIKRIASDSVLFAELSSGAQRSAHPHSPAGVLERIEAALQ